MCVLGGSLLSVLGLVEYRHLLVSGFFGLSEGGEEEEEREEGGEGEAGDEAFILGGAAPGESGEVSEDEVVGVSERLVASSDEDHEVGQVGARTHDLVSREVSHPAPFTAQSGLPLGVEQTLEVLVLDYLSLGSGSASEDVVDNVSELRDVGVDAEGEPHRRGEIGNLLLLVILVERYSGERRGSSLVSLRNGRVDVLLN